MKTTFLTVSAIVLMTACVPNPAPESPDDIFSGGKGYNLTPTQPVAPAPVIARPEKQANPVMVKEKKMVKEVEVVIPEAPEEPQPQAVVSTGESFSIATKKNPRGARQAISNCAAGLEISPYTIGSEWVSGQGTKLTVKRPENVSLATFERFENCVKNLFAGAEQSAALRDTPANEPL